MIMREKSKKYAEEKKTTFMYRYFYAFLRVPMF